MHLTLKTSVAVNKLLSNRITYLQSVALPIYRSILDTYGSSLNNFVGLEKEELRKTKEYIEYSDTRTRIISIKKKLKTLHKINSHLKSQIRFCNGIADVVYLRFTEPELQFLLQFLRIEAYIGYNLICFDKAEACAYYEHAVKDGSEDGKVSFKLLNKARDSRRKALKEVKLLEEAIKAIKHALRSNNLSNINPRFHRKTSSTKLSDTATKYFGYILNKIWRN